MKKYKIAQEYAKLHHKQVGMTLIELAVVLLILIGLAGLMLPYVSGFVEKTHNSTTVDTIAELNKAVQLYKTTKWAAPNNLETLVDVGGTSLYSKLQDSSMLSLTASGGGASPVNAANTALAKAGIKSVYANNNATTDATFQSTSGSAATVTAFATSVALAFLNGTTAADTFFGQLASPTADKVKNQLIYAFGGSDATWDTVCTNYVVMGIGSANSMVGSTMQAVPVHFAGTGDQQPTLQYNRYVAVFAVHNGASTGTNTVTGKACPAEAGNAATFVGSAMIMPFPAIVGLQGAQQYANGHALD
jgi:type II secretory pathway pseudopilin PulG